MSSLKRFAILAAAIAVLAPTAIAQQLPRNSFVRKPVYSTQQLIDHVQSDPVVMKHYRKLYEMKEDDLISFFRSLRVGRTDRTQVIEIFNVDKYGVIRSRMLTVKKGTLAFFAPDGKIVMIKSCGNPTRYRPDIVKPPTLIVMDTPITPEITETVPMPELIPGPVISEYIVPPDSQPSDLVIVPLTTVVEKEKITRRRDFIPIPIPIPITKTRIKKVKCDVIPGPAAAISFGAMAVGARLRRRRRTA